MPAFGYRIRREALPDDALVVVRGGLLEIGTLRTDAVAAHERFGECGVSVFGAADVKALDALLVGRLKRFDLLTVMTAGALRAAGLELAPTFRRPHYTVMLANLEADLLRLVTCENVAWVNPHYEPPEATP